MRRIRAFLIRLGGLFRKGYQDRQLAEEIESHLQLHIDDNLRAGMSPEEARRQALLRLGGVEQTIEAYRDRRSFPLLDSVVQDLRYGFRVLRRSPGFALVAMGTLALGIGANTAIFSLVNVVMLRLLPVQHPEQLVELLQKYPGYPRGSLGWSSQSYENLRDNNHVFSKLTGTSFDNIARVRTEGSEPEVVVCEFVVGNFFPTLGVKPAIGRLIGPNDTFYKGAVGVTVVSWSYWNSRFHLDPAVLGKRIVVNDQPMVIIGVAPRGFLGIRAESRTDVWVPRERTDGISCLLGRLRPGVSIKQVRAEMSVLYESTLEEIAKTNKDPLVRQQTVEVEPAGSGLARIRDYYAKPLIALTAIVGLLLLIACSNLASLLLARAVARQREMAVRVSLGAGRGRLIRQVLTESWLLSLMGTLFGIVFAYVSTGVLVRIIGSGREHERFALQVQPDLHLLIFTVAATLVTSLLFGMPPALQAFRTGTASAMRQAGAIGETKGSRLFGKSLVASQVAFSIVLLTAATLFVGNLWHLENLDLGFSRDHVLLLSLDPEQGGYKPEQLPHLYQDLLSRLQAIPGVLSASISGVTPIQGAGFGGHFVSAEGYQERPEDRRRVSLNLVAPRYFETLRTPFLAGRDFEFEDERRSRVAIINQSMRQYFFGDAEPIGRHITFDGDSKPYEVVGVVGDANYLDIRERPSLAMYLNMFQESRMFSQFALRTSVDPVSIAADVRRTVRESLKSVPVTREITLADQVDASIVPERLLATLSGLFGALGLLIAAVGIYGLLSYTTQRRTHEIGIRMALGGSRHAVAGMVLRDALKMVCAGLLIGAPLAFSCRRLAASLLPDLEVTIRAPLIFGTATILAAALLAAWIPAQRAARIDPMNALRHE